MRVKVSAQRQFTPSSRVLLALCDKPRDRLWTRESADAVPRRVVHERWALHAEIRRSLRSFDLDSFHDVPQVAELRD